jgi:hypothetical protein
MWGAVTDGNLRSYRHAGTHGGRDVVFASISARRASVIARSLPTRRPATAPEPTVRARAEAVVAIQVNGVGGQRIHLIGLEPRR